METLKNTFEKIINELNEKIRFLEEDKEDISSNFHQSEVSLKHQIEKLRRQNSLLKEENQKNLDSVRNHSGNEIITRLKDLEEKNETLTRNLAQKERVFREDIDHKEEMVRTLENENRDLSRQVDRQRTSAREALNERTQLRSRISVLQKEKQCLEEEIARLKRAIDTRVTSNNEERGLRIRQLQEKLSEAIRKQKDTRQKTIELLEKYQQTEAQLKLQHENQIANLLAENTKLRRKLAKK